MNKHPATQRIVVLITGCSSGLGAAIAQRLLRCPQYDLIVTARAKSMCLLRELFQPSERMMVSELDVTNDNQIQGLVNDICVRWGRLDVLINNAGVCFRSVVEHMDIDAEYIQLKTNYLGPMSLIRSALPIMREQGQGHIINISSVSGMVSMPTMASYSASKHALEGATESLWYEARPYGIKVSLIQPGFIRSDSFKNVLLPKKAHLSVRLRGPHSEYYSSLAPFIERLMNYSMATPDSIAKKIEHLIMMKDPPLRCPVTMDAILFSILRRVLPESIFHRLMFFLLPGSQFWGKKRKLRARAIATLDKNAPAH